MIRLFREARLTLAGTLLLLLASGLDENVRGGRKLADRLYVQGHLLLFRAAGI
jgi:hypothetical protein